MRGVSKAFGSKSVLRDLWLSLPKGTSTALIGESASGKSVLLKTAAGLLHTDQGEIDVLDQTAVSDWEEARARIGILFQRNALFDGMRVWENVAFPLRRKGMKSPRAKDTAVQILSSVGLNDRAAESFPAALSGGMQKRAALARAIAGDPDLLLLDDPTAGLDPVMSASVEQLIRHLIRRHQATGLIVTSNLQNLSDRFDRVAILDSGGISWIGDAGDLPMDAHPLLQSV